MIISLPNGKVVHVPYSEFLFLEDEEIHVWYQNKIADDEGQEVNNPFLSFKSVETQFFDIPDIEDIDKNKDPE